MCALSSAGKLSRSPTNRLAPESIAHCSLPLFLLVAVVVAEPQLNFSELCGAEGHPLIMPPDQRIRACQRDEDCLPPPAFCHQHTRLCCALPLGQEPPPIGCPKGTRQLRNAQGDWLSCTPTRPGSCPGGTLCYEDSVDNRHRCCGKDPGEGCGTGQRVLRHLNGSTMLCMPGGAEECPGNAVCEWSFAIDRFQCCEPDSGCLGTEFPLFDANDEVLSCSPSSLVSRRSCPEGSVCRFNFWTAAHQCCAAQREGTIMTSPTAIKLIGGPPPPAQEKERGVNCPRGEIPLVELGSIDTRECADTRDCPRHFHCHAGICCGPPGECPRPREHPLHDRAGNVLLCSLHHPELCPAEAKCRETLDPHTRVCTGQRVCCGPRTFACAAVGEPFPSAESPQLCQRDDPISCPMETICQASNVPGVDICCRGETNGEQLCPRGWSPHAQLNIFCHPTIRSSCPHSAACILSPLTLQFVCCEPSELAMAEAEGTALLHHSEPRDSSSPFDASIGLVRPRSAALSCPNADDRIELVGGLPRHCTTDGRVPCGNGFLCEPSAQNVRLSVCCSAHRSPSRQRPRQHDDPAYRCPSAQQVPVLEGGQQNVFCDLGAQQCPSGSSCVSALNAFGMMICCRNVRQPMPVCPVGMRAEPSAIGYTLCDLMAPNQCSEGHQCVRAPNDPEATICCSRVRNQPLPSTANLLCPDQQVLYRDGAGPRYCAPHADPRTSCPGGYSCEEALGQPGVFVCCSMPATPVCPQGFLPSLDLRTQNPIHCSLSDMSMCPNGARCLPAQNRDNAFLCCESREPGRVCPVVGQVALLQANRRPEECTGPGSACSRPSYTCQLSHVLNRYVCCGPPNTAVICADGRETYQQEPGRTVQCSPMSWPSDCPAGYECSLSSLPQVHVCCRRQTVPPTPSPQEPNTADLPVPIPPTPRSAVTFRPPVEELSCPVGWSAYEDQRGAHHFCQDALDMTCPHGFSCAQSSVIGIFMCCRLASAIQCPQAYSTLMVNNNPRLCSLSARRSVPTAGRTSIGTQTGADITNAATLLNSCPSGYTCMQSSVPAVYVCCGANTLPSQPAGLTGRTDLYCADGQIPAYLGQLVRYCGVLGQTTECPPSYVCAASNRSGIFVCCHPYQYPMITRRSPKPMRNSTKSCRSVDEVELCPENGKPAN